MCWMPVPDVNSGRNTPGARPDASRLDDQEVEEGIVHQVFDEVLLNR
jgi:hypothetical protein